jgi:hypothetical protein
LPQITGPQAELKGRRIKGFILPPPSLADLDDLYGLCVAGFGRWKKNQGRQFSNPSPRDRKFFPFLRRFVEASPRSPKAFCQRRKR